MGNMYMFFYDPKFKKTLPYYDGFPLIIMLGPAPNGFYGLNLHYLPYNTRAKFLDDLMAFGPPTPKESSRLTGLRYNLISGVRKFKEFRPCFKHYLGTNVRSQFARVPMTDWEIAIFLPVEQFKKSSKQAVWQDSLKQARSPGGISIKNTKARNFINDPRDISLLCDSVTIPAKQVSTLDYQTIKQSFKVPYGTIEDEVSLGFLLTNDYYMKTIFDRWINSIVDPDKYCVAYKDDITCDVIIQQLDEQDTPIYGVKLENAFPTTMSEIGLSNESASQIQKLNVSFTYDKCVPEGALSSTGSLIRNALSIFG